VKDIKRQTKPPAKKTEIGRTLLDMMDDSEMAMLHLEEYPVYLQVPFCLGRKGCVDVLDRCVVMMETSNFIYATEIILRLGLGGCLGDFDGNETKEVKEASFTNRLVRLLKDQEPRTRKAVVSILWKICVQSFSPFFRFGQTKKHNKSQIWVEEKEKATKKAGEEEQQQQQGSGGAKNIARNLLGLKRIPSAKNETKTGTGAELVNRIVAMLKDNHASVQDDAIDAMKQLADISTSLLTQDQRHFFLNELLPIGTLPLPLSLFSLVLFFIFYVCIKLLCINVYLLVEDAGEISDGGGLTEWRHLVNSAISVMKTFDLYEWLMRWLSHDQPGIRLLVFTALGLLGYPLVETKQKLDPMRRASSWVCLPPPTPIGHISNSLSIGVRTTLRGLCTDFTSGICGICKITQRQRRHLHNRSNNNTRKGQNRRRRGHRRGHLLDASLQGDRLSCLRRGGGKVSRPRLDDEPPQVQSSVHP